MFLGSFRVFLNVLRKFSSFFKCFKEVFEFF